MRSISYQEFFGLLLPALNYRVERSIMADALKTLTGSGDVTTFTGSDALLDAYIERIAEGLDVDPEVLAKVVFDDLDSTEAYDLLSRS